MTSPSLATEATIVSQSGRANTLAEKEAAEKYTTVSIGRTSLFREDGVMGLNCSVFSCIENAKSISSDIVTEISVTFTVEVECVAPQTTRMTRMCRR